MNADLNGEFVRDVFTRQHRRQPKKAGKHRCFLVMLLATLVCAPLLGIGQPSTNVLERSTPSGAAQGRSAFSRISATQKLATDVVAHEQSVRLGDPIMVSVLATNASTEASFVNRNATALSCFKVTDPDGVEMTHVGYDGQVVVNPVMVQPFSIVKIADVDLTDKYLFRKPGRYSVRFSGSGSGGLADSPAITIDVTPGHLSEFDQIALSLLFVLPEGWRLAKSRGEAVVPPGRLRVPGKAFHLCYNHMQSEAVLFWLARAEAKIDPTNNSNGTVKDLGSVRGIYIYADVQTNTPPRWPTVHEDISRALQTLKQ